ncbi:DUF1330 domain-containing protein [Aquimarina spongiae]|uniref:Uncharacterized conserved protein, DUF1330 family n=1 Tax=Aquimarina spongiae TaxID=570521 RepID=A0A1M6I2V9_9FLAO|nr:DUF1330 domain-containing protein [Aquimarina spongiae]SHJ28766.1 Uncharacterized conserved protein, DUF1330 family [Aquimarina spongiae]
MNNEKVIMIVSAQINPNQKEALDGYLEAAAPMFKAAGGTPINKYKIEGQLVGSHPTSLVSIMEFPSQESLLKVFESEDYKFILPLRDKAFLNLDVYISES